MFAGHGCGTKSRIILFISHQDEWAMGQKLGLLSGGEAGPVDKAGRSA
jgi:hypothetical protein